MQPPLLLVGHGTRDEEGVADFGAFVGRLGRRVAGRRVAGAGGFIGPSAPPPTAALDRGAPPGFEDKVRAAQTPHRRPDDPAHGHGHGH